jgi:O-phosphoseryl-tRNA(Cys) synthetase
MEKIYQYYYTSIYDFKLNDESVCKILNLPKNSQITETHYDKAASEVAQKMAKKVEKTCPCEFVEWGCVIEY